MDKQKIGVLLFHIIFVSFGLYLIWYNGTPVYESNHKEIPDSFIIVGKQEVYCTTSNAGQLVLKYQFYFVRHNSQYDNKLCIIEVNKTIYDKYELWSWVLKNDIQ